MKVIEVTNNMYTYAGVMNRCRTQLGAKTLRFVLSVDRSCSDEQR